MEMFHYRLLLASRAFRKLTKQTQFLHSLRNNAQLGRRKIALWSLINRLNELNQRAQPLFDWILCVHLVIDRFL